MVAPSSPPLVPPIRPPWTPFGLQRLVERGDMTSWPSQRYIPSEAAEGIRRQPWWTLWFHSLDFPSIPWLDMEQAALLAAAPSRPVTLVAAPRCFLFVQPKSSCVEASFVFLSTTQIRGGECTSVSLKPCLSWYKTGREETRVVPLPNCSIASQPSKEWTQIH